MSSPADAATTTTAARTVPAWAVPLLLFVAAGLFYAINLNLLPHPDELYQILPAEGLLATGQPRLADGLYHRAYAQTWAIAESFRFLGHSLPAARLSSVLGIAATVALLFAWLRRSAGPGAAWIGAVGFAVSPFAVGTAHFARIYGLQTLAFFLTCLLVYAAFSPPGPFRPREGQAGGWGLAPAGDLGRRAVALVLALPCLALAVHLQPTTLLGGTGLALWVAGTVALPWLADRDVPARRKLAVVGGLFVLVLAVLAAAWSTGLLRSMWHTYRSAPIFNQKNESEFYYYHALYSLLYPSLWPLTGILALAAVATWPAVGTLALCVFAMGFLLNSFGGPKNLRYIAYAQPFLFMIWGMGLALVGRALIGYVASLGPQLAARMPVSVGAARGVATLLVAGAVLFLVAANPASIRTVMLLADLSIPGEEQPPDWAEARPALEPYLERVPVVVTTEELGTLYYLGRFDIRFSPSKLGEIDAGDRREFAPDPRTGRAVISTPATLNQVFDCYPEGLFLLASRQWNHAHLFSPEIQDLVRARTQPLPLPKRSSVTAYTWRHPEGYQPPASCASIPPMPGPAARVPTHG